MINKSECFLVSRRYASLKGSMYFILKSDKMARCVHQGDENALFKVSLFVPQSPYLLIHLKVIQLRDCAVEVLMD
jgi:hypothetical protein